ncbi:major facilitator superfamily domain-containing protein [Cokeromyces recurvatus]|uniref:major facilitator superfamily domain-containing protein n=1 Tax=Cokeromyces recurvatus TaxID=90255 RepID=UPI00221E4BEE|nr:major facilitator superfamily domain-containing protein [Cokeromyces recurvatus]KAI7899621.1 major facilitator superfamily domain-containing protein [Cokeromyces recurvatus]
MLKFKDLISRDHTEATKNQDAESKTSLPITTKKKLYLIILSLCVISFIAAFDNIIVASNTPLVAAEFNGFSLYSWVNTAFLLTASTSQPIYGKCADIVGRKICLLFATASYLFGIILCGAAQSMIMFIIARAFCGLGIGAFDTLMKIIVADYIPVRYIGMYQSMLGISWGLGYIVGALLGGVATSKAGWRIVFWMALGFSIIALLLIFISIENHLQSYHTMYHQLTHIDLYGILLWSISVVCLVLALSWGGSTYDWNSTVIIVLLCISGVLLFAFALFEHKFAKDPIIPRGILANRSTCFILFSAFCYGGCFQSLMTYIPLYLTVIRKEESMASNLELLCLVLFACIFNVLTGITIVKSGKYTWASRTSLSILVIACGLLNMLTPQSSRGFIVGLMIITGIGSGGMINSEIITAQASVSIENVPTIVAFMTFCDQVGGITGITTQGSILSNTLTKGLNSIHLPNVIPELVRQSSDYLWSLPEPTQTIVSTIYMDAIKMSFWGSFAFATVGLISALGLKSYVLRKELVMVKTEEDLSPNEHISAPNIISKC